MAFEFKNQSGDSVLYKHNFTTKDFEVDQLLTDSFIVPLPFGEMNLRQWFFNGIRMIYTESVITDTAVLDWKSNMDFITMYFYLQGKFSILDKNMPKAFELSSNQHNMFYSKEAEGKMKFSELRMKSFLIQFSKNSFLNIANDGNDSIKRFADNVASGKSVAFADSNLNIDLPLQNCINGVLNCNYSDSLKKMFLFSKAIEMLVLQAESFDKVTNRETQYINKDYDKERILFARDYLLRNIEAPPTLTVLSRIAGINEYKLKRGFKETFNQTVFEYLSGVRLELAKNDLLERRKSVTEIAFGLGYSSLQHFSAAFKKKFGVAPSKVG
jgi:AraC family transcriptional activator of pyochelin receptor